MKEVALAVVAAVVTIATMWLILARLASSIGCRPSILLAVQVVPLSIGFMLLFTGRTPEAGVVFLGVALLIALDVAPRAPEAIRHEEAMQAVQPDEEFGPIRSEGPRKVLVKSKLNTAGLRALSMGLPFLLFAVLIAVGVSDRFALFQDSPRVAWMIIGFGVLSCLLLPVWLVVEGMVGTYQFDVKLGQFSYVHRIGQLAVGRVRIDQTSITGVRVRYPEGGNGSGFLELILDSGSTIRLLQVANLPYERVAEIARYLVVNDRAADRPSASVTCE